MPIYPLVLEAGAPDFPVFLGPWCSYAPLVTYLALAYNFSSPLLCTYFGLRGLA